MIFQKTGILFSVILYANGFILNDKTIPHLPQYVRYGKSMVLVGGNLQDNNTEIYNTIVEMAVSTAILILSDTNSRV